MRTGAISREIKLLFQLKKTERLWHIPLMASFCIGLPLLIGYAFNLTQYGVSACLGGLVILYMPSTALENRMLTLALCALGFIASFSLGIIFTFNPILASVVIGLFAFGVNWLTNYFSLRSPGNFFFIMLASMASCLPFELNAIPTKIGLVALGSLLACMIAFFYSLYITKKYPDKLQSVLIQQKRQTGISQSITIGFFIFLSLFVAHFFKLDNPYWLPVSCLAVMQGISASHVWQRTFHRILGTFLGIGLAWLLVQFNLTVLAVCLIILALQFIVEMLIARHYALAVVFITPMTIFLADLGQGQIVSSDHLIFIRILDISIGAFIGAIGGWVLHNQKFNSRMDRKQN